MDGLVATRRITLIWVVREAEHLQWAEPWMGELLSRPGTGGVFQAVVFVTRMKPGVDGEKVAASEWLQICCGRPDVRNILDQEVRQQIGAMCVTVCGPGSFADDVRSAVRGVQQAGCVDFIEESFSW